MPLSDGPGRDSKVDFALSVLLSLIEDYHDFNPDTVVPVYPYPADVQFSQQVGRGRPCVYRPSRSVLDDRAQGNYAADDGEKGEYPQKWAEGRDRVRQVCQNPSQRRLERDLRGREQHSILDAPCFRWTKKTLCGVLTNKVEVAVTPDGRADSIYAVPQKRRSQPGTNLTSIRGSQEVYGENDRGLRAEFEYIRLGDEPEQSAAHEQVFLQPATIHMTLSRLIDELCPLESSLSSYSPGDLPTPVYYLQSQDSNLTRPEMSPLLAHLPATPPPFARHVFGDPEATNVWIGNERSVTSTHRDPYENIYLVVKGRKTFVLYPPVEEICLHAEMVRTGRWTYDEDRGKFEIVMDEAMSSDVSSTALRTLLEDAAPDEPPRIPWIPIDPLKPPPTSSDRYPYYKHARPLTVTVNEGEILYLPAGWFHHVSQECGRWEDEDGGLTVAPCIAINYWFDVDYSGEKHVMREMVGRLVEQIRMSERT